MSHAHRLGVDVQVCAYGEDSESFTLNTAGIVSPAWVAFDGYQFDLAHQQAAADAGFRVLVVDDHAHLPEYDVDILLNQNLDSERLPYTTMRAVKRLHGPAYALLRPEFAMRCFQGSRNAEDTMRVLVAVGGGDDRGLVGQMVAVLEALPEKPKVTIVAGGAHPDVKQMQRLVEKRTQWRLLHNVADMSEIMAQSDIAISTAGSACWELCCIGVPMILFVIAENQEGIANALAAHGAAINMGWHENWGESQLRAALTALIQQKELREDMARAGQGIVDGHGADRVVQSMLSLSAAN